MNLFTPLADSLALDMLDHINEGRKPKERYEPQYAIQEKGHIIYMAANKNKEVLFNALTDMGELPKNMSVNWRTWEHIKQDLGLGMKLFSMFATFNKKSKYL